MKNLPWSTNFLDLNPIANLSKKLKPTFQIFQEFQYANVLHLEKMLLESPIPYTLQFLDLMTFWASSNNFKYVVCTSFNFKIESVWHLYGMFGTMPWLFICGEQESHWVSTLLVIVAIWSSRKSYCIDFTIALVHKRFGNLHSQFSITYGEPNQS